MFNGKQSSENKSKIGIFGENSASDYLKKKGYKIIEKNFRRPWGEIDIVCRTKEKTLVFVEVKTMAEGNLTPEDNVTKSKMGKMKKAAMLYAGHESENIDEIAGWRIDVVAITIALKNERCEIIKIEHYENVG